jgi:hypothetical protein
MHRTPWTAPLPCYLNTITGNWSAAQDALDRSASMESINGARHKSAKLKGNRKDTWKETPVPPVVKETGPAVCDGLNQSIRNGKHTNEHGDDDT